MAHVRHNNFLNTYQCLVYLDDNTHIARLLGSYIRDDILYYDLKLVTDNNGHHIQDNYIRTVTGDAIVSEISPRDINPKVFYHFGAAASENRVKANGFVLDHIIERPIETTSRSSLGSGIYGIYVTDDINPLLTSTDEVVYSVQLTNPYILFDKPHGQSLTTASLHTNRYVDYVIQALRFDHHLSIDDAVNIIDENPLDNILTLWNIVFYRTYQTGILTKEALTSILAEYVVNYLNDKSLIDSQNGAIIHEMPINHIMRAFRFDGLLADDRFNNGWDRGCISYNYVNPQIHSIRGHPPDNLILISGSRAPY